MERPDFDTTMYAGLAGTLTPTSPPIELASEEQRAKFVEAYGLWRSGLTSRQASEQVWGEDSPRKLTSRLGKLRAWTTAEGDPAFRMAAYRCMEILKEVDDERPPTSRSSSRLLGAAMRNMERVKVLADLRAEAQERAKTEAEAKAKAEEDALKPQGKEVPAVDQKAEEAAYALDLRAPEGEADWDMLGVALKHYQEAYEKKEEAKDIVLGHQNAIFGDKARRHWGGTNATYERCVRLHAGLMARGLFQAARSYALLRRRMSKHGCRSWTCWNALARMSQEAARAEERKDWLVR